MRNSSLFYLKVFLFFVLVYYYKPILYGYENFESNSNQLLPMSGSEPHFKPTYWDSPSFVKTNNCYAYFLNDIQSRYKKPQPGDTKKNKNETSQSNWKHRNSSNCSQTIERIQKDNPEIYKVSKNTPCKKGYYKGYLAIDPERDYHFYRQDSNGLFSHKPGKNPVTSLDASGNLIPDPELSDRNFKSLGYNYSESCGFLCVPDNNTSKTNST